MNTPTRRRWFQVHLSTCVVLMFVAGGVIWANVRVQKTIEPDAVVRELGWPLVYNWERCEWGDVSSPGVACFSDHSNMHVAADAAIGIAILFAVALVLEWRIRRRIRSMSQ